MKKIFVASLFLCAFNGAIAQMNGGQSTFGANDAKAPEEAPKGIEREGVGSGNEGTEVLKALAAQNAGAPKIDDKSGQVIVRKPTKAVSPENYRVALVIGNSNYKYDIVKTAVNDVPMISQSLLNAGFEVIEIINAPKDVFFKQVAEFVEKSKTAAYSVFYFGGHAVNYNSENYLIPLNSEPTAATDLPSSGYNVSLLLKGLKADKSDKKQGRQSLVLLDASRYNQFYYTMGIKRQKALAPVTAPEGVLVLAASSDGNNAETANKTSLFAYVLSVELTESKSIADVTKATKSQVESLSGGMQKPWINGKAQKTNLLN